MAELRLSGRAQADLRALLALSRAHHGEEGEVRYVATLAAAMEMIAAAPEGPNTRARPELGPGIRCLHSRRARRSGGVRAPVHVIYYRIGVGSIVDVLGVLHERMDPHRHLRPTSTSTSTRRKRR